MNDPRVINMALKIPAGIKPGCPGFFSEILFPRLNLNLSPLGPPVDACWQMEPKENDEWWQLFLHSSPFYLVDGINSSSFHGRSVCEILGFWHLNCRHWQPASLHFHFNYETRTLLTKWMTLFSSFHPLDWEISSSGFDPFQPFQPSPNWEIQSRRRDKLTSRFHGPAERHLLRSDAINSIHCSIPVDRWGFMPDH